MLRFICFFTCLFMGLIWEANGQCVFPPHIIGTWYHDESVGLQGLYTFNTNGQVIWQYSGNTLSFTFTCLSTGSTITDSSVDHMVLQLSPSSHYCVRITSPPGFKALLMHMQVVTGGVSYTHCPQLINLQADVQWLVAVPVPVSGISFLVPQGVYQTEYKTYLTTYCPNNENSRVWVKDHQWHLHTCYNGPRNFSYPLANRVLTSLGRLPGNALDTDNNGDVVIFGDLTDPAKPQYYCGRYEQIGSLLKLSLNIKDAGQPLCSVGQSASSARPKEFLSLTLSYRGPGEPPGAGVAPPTVTTVRSLPTVPTVTEPTVPTVPEQTVPIPSSSLCGNGCGNHGRCVLLSDGTRRCVCDSEFHGDFCQIALCPSGCINGDCVLTVDDVYRCLCNEGFTGAQCDEERCLSNPCQNKGSCSESATGFTCVCEENFYGSECEYETEAGNDQKMITLGILVGVLAAIIIAIIIVVCVVYRSRRAKANSEGEAMYDAKNPPTSSDASDPTYMGGSLVAGAVPNTHWNTSYKEAPQPFTATTASNGATVIMVQ